MISHDEIKKLAALSRLELSEEEIVQMQGDMDAILAYVDKLKNAPSKGAGPAMLQNINVMREDINPHKGGINTEKLIKAAPSHTAEHVKVKKILGQSQ